MSAARNQRPRPAPRVTLITVEQWSHQHGPAITRHTRPLADALRMSLSIALRYPVPLETCVQTAFVRQGREWVAL